MISETQEEFRKWYLGWIRTMMSIGTHPETIWCFEKSAKELETKLFKHEEATLDGIQDKQ